MKQRNRSVAEYEAEFASLSRFEVELVATDDHRCQRFRFGLNSSITTRLTSFRERDYADLVDMARKIGRDVEELNEKRLQRGRFGGKSSEPLLVVAVLVKIEKGNLSQGSRMISPSRAKLGTDRVVTLVR